nr:DUF6701 domain-containing protein [uncultured Glaciecola sp.]
MTNRSLQSLKVIGMSLLFVASANSIAASCLDVFPTVLSSSSNKGKAEFEQLVDLYGTNGSVDIQVESDETTDDNPSCISQKCQDSKNRAEALSLPKFMISNSKVNKTVDDRKTLSLPQGSYQNILVKYQAKLHFTKTTASDQVTFIKNLTSVEETIITFDEGVYWIETFEIGYKTKIVINENDKVTLIINNKGKDAPEFVQNEVSFNGGGTPDQLVLIAYEDVRFKYKASFNGFIYGNKKVELQNESVFEGAINADEVKLKYKAAITYAPDSIDTANFNDFCSVSNPTPTPVVTVDYRFDECAYEGVANEVIDQSGRYNGGSNGVPNPINEAVINKSLNLSADGNDDWVYIPSGAVDGLDDFSVSVWFKTAVAKSQQEIFHALGDNADDDELEIYLVGSNQVHVKVGNKGLTLNTNINFDNNSWHYLVITRVGMNACLFIDSAKQACDDGLGEGALSVINANAVIIGQEQDKFGGGFSTEQNFVGRLNEFKLFDGRLSASQIRSIYQNELANNNYDGSTRDENPCDNSCDTGILNAVGIKIDSRGRDNQIDTTTEALAIHSAWLAAGSPASGSIDNGAYNVAATGSSSVDRIDFGGLGHDFTGTLSYPGVGAGVTDSNFLVHTSGTLSLPAGDYTIFVESDDGFSFVMNTLSGDTVLFDKFGASGSGGSNELRFEGTTSNTNTGGSFTLSQDSVFDIVSIFFERNGSDYLEISIANNIRTNAAPEGYEILRDGAINGKVDFGQCAAPSLINHYQIIHDGQGLTCAAEKVTINACTNAYDGSCTLSNETVRLDVKAMGSNSVTDGIMFNGSGTASIPYTLAESVFLSLQNISRTTDKPVICANGNSSSCELVFTDAGFRFLNARSSFSETITNQTSGKSFPLRLQAVKNSDGVCEGLFTGDKEIAISQENITPISPDGLNFSIDGTDISKSPNFTKTTLNFGAHSIAIIPTPIYHDAGKIRLHADYSVGGVALSASSNTFWVAPDKFVVSAKLGTVVLDGATATATPTHPAGDNFDLIVTAFNSLGLITTNYSPGQMQFKLKRIGPPDGTNGYLRYGLNGVLQTNHFEDVTITEFSFGVSTFSAAQYSEVGLLNLDVQDSNYGSVNIIVPASAINIGRFIPKYFTQTVADNGAFFAACNVTTAFAKAAYSGQMDEATNTIGAISYFTNPVMEITARNSQGETTQNYFNDYMKLTNADIIVNTPTFDQMAKGVDSNPLPLTANMNTGTLSQYNMTATSSGNALPRGVLHYQLSAADNFFYQRSANALVAPFVSDIDFSIATIIDTDNVQVNRNVLVDDIPVAASPSGVDIRFGRLLLENSFGPETSNFPQLMQIEHFDGTAFIVSSDESCASYDADRVSLTNISLDASHTSALGGAGIFSNGKTQTIELKAPGAGNQGQIVVLYDAYDWFKYDWDNDGAYDDSPEAVATFGIYRGNDRTIHWREVFND